MIEHQGALERGVTPIAVAVTGKLGRADTGGIWTRPDITCVLVHTPYGVAEDDFTRVMNVAAAEGVGFITADDPSDFDTWDERVAPERIQTDPALLDAFIRKQLPETDRAAIASAVSGL